MTEKQWTESVKNYLTSLDIADNIKIGTLIKIPYTREILGYKSNFKPWNELSMRFETDMLIYEQDNDIIKPRIIIEAKLSKVTTHDAIVYSYKAQNHKAVTPFIRYGIIIGNRRTYPLPGRLFRHGVNFDFMMSFKKEEICKDEQTAFIDLIKSELAYSRQFEEMIFKSRSSNRKRYSVMQKKLYLTEMTE